MTFISRVRRIILVGASSTMTMDQIFLRPAMTQRNPLSRSGQDRIALSARWSHVTLAEHCQAYMISLIMEQGYISPP